MHQTACQDPPENRCQSPPYRQRPFPVRHDLPQYRVTVHLIQMCPLHQEYSGKSIPWQGPFGHYNFVVSTVFLFFSQSKPPQPHLTTIIGQRYTHQKPVPNPVRLAPKRKVAFLDDSVPGRTRCFKRKNDSYRYRPAGMRHGPCEFEYRLVNDVMMDNADILIVIGSTAKARSQDYPRLERFGGICAGPWGMRRPWPS